MCYALLHGVSLQLKELIQVQITLSYDPSILLFEVAVQVEDTLKVLFVVEVQQKLVEVGEDHYLVLLPFRCFLVHDLEDSVVVLEHVLYSLCCFVCSRLRQSINPFSALYDMLLLHEYVQVLSQLLLIGFVGVAVVCKRRKK